MSQFYSLSATDVHGQTVSMDKFRGKKLLIVNTASECGYTGQYAALQELYKGHESNRFEIIAFPSNDFGGQEPGNDGDILRFCELTYKVSFPVMAKSHVLNEGANEVYKWLATQDAIPEWNFSKFLVSEHGLLVHQVAASEHPLTESLMNWLYE